MKKLLEEAGHVPSLIPSWKPDERTSEDLAKHISELCIPINSAGNPNMLLHDLGEERDDLDAQRNARIPNILSSTHHTCVNVTFINLFHFDNLLVSRILINTSGSGKTRLLLEG